jgi:hypothetical protein
LFIKTDTMDKQNRPADPAKQHGGITDKKDKNAGSGAFNQGAEQDEHLNEGVADGTPNPEQVSREKENPKSGNIGKNNAGGYEG